MRALRFLLPLLVLGIAAPALADDTYLGTITSAGSSTTNLTTATPFRLYSKTKISVQCDAAVYVKEGQADDGSALAVTSSNGLQLSATSLFDIALGFTGTAVNYQLAILPVSGTANCKVFVST